MIQPPTQILPLKLIVPEAVSAVSLLKNCELSILSRRAELAAQPDVLNLPDRRVLMQV